MSNPPGVTSASQVEPTCASAACTNAVVPGADHCNDCMLKWPDGGSPNGGADGSLSDGTTGSNDASAGWSDGSLRAWTPDGELRVMGSDSKTIRVSGTPIVYSPWTTISDDDGPFKERVLKTAIEPILSDGSNRYLLLHHNWAFPLASTKAGTLHLRNTDQGLQMAADLDAKNPTAMHVASCIDKGLMKGMSFAFTITPDGESWDPSMTHRTLTRFKAVREVTITATPAYATTNVQVLRSLQRREELRVKGDRFRRGEEIRHIRKQLEATNG